MASPSEPPAALRVFALYAPQDVDVHREIKDHCQYLHNAGKILWLDSEISPGQDPEVEIYQRISTASIVLLLLSINFTREPYCNGRVNERLKERYNNERRSFRVIPIRLQSFTWQDPPLSTLRSLPHDPSLPNSQTITHWQNTDRAYENIARGLERVIEEFRNPQPLGRTRTLG